MGYGTSLSHGWGSGPTSWLSQYVLGVWPEEPGFAVVSIKPHLCDLSWAEGNVPTPQGIIHVRHEQTNGAFRSTVALPTGMPARLGVPKVAGEATKATVRSLSGGEVVPLDADATTIYFRVTGGGQIEVEAQ